MSDAELLRQFVQGRSQPAFAELVRRHVDWVHSAALRRVHDRHLAEDVTQATFLVLAQKAASLQNQRVLAAWLFHVVANISARAQQRESSRRHHEKQAAQAIERMLQEQSSAPVQQEWDQIVTVLDEVVGRLRRSDRETVLLRFYEQRSFSDVAQTLGISEEAARKRLSRAVEKLREMLTAKGVSMPAATLGGMLLIEVVKPAPAALAATVSVSAGTAATTAVSSLAKGAMTMLTIAKVKVVVAVTAAILFTTGGAAVVTYTLAQQQPTRSPTSSPAEVATVDDRQAIQGSWLLMSVISDGISQLPPDQAGKQQLVISATEMRGSTAAPSPYVMDSAPGRKWIDVAGPQRQTTLGIYDLNGDNLRICLSPNLNSRPTDFTSEPGSKRDLMVLKRGQLPATQAAVGPGDRARVAAAKTDVASLETAMDTFEVDIGRYPGTNEGLAALFQAPAGVRNWHGPYVRLRAVPNDPWRQPYRYAYPGVHNPRGFDLWSTGPDGIDKTADDIGNWPSN